MNTNTYGMIAAPLKTASVDNRDMVSPKYGSPLFTDYDHDGLMLDLYGTFTDEYDVMDVSIAGTRYSVLKLVSESLLKDMNAFCERRHLEVCGSAT